MPHRKDFFELILTLDDNIVTKVGIKLMHHLSDKLGNVGNCGTLTPMFHNLLNPYALKLSNFMSLSRINPRNDVFLKQMLFLKLKEIIRIGIFRGIPWGRGHDLPFLFGL